MQPYKNYLYETWGEETRYSAETIISIVLELMTVRSAVDVGCGVGTWLSVFKDFGVDDIWGIEGKWVDKKLLLIPEESFSYFDLTLPLDMGRTFDLAISLEVAEHLPVECAETIVDSLIRLAPVIVFSAAIPGQGGTCHLNEQWPDYWAHHFKERGYEVIDCIRREIWRDDRVLWWYRQNILVFVQSDRLQDYPLLKREYDVTNTSQLCLVHPVNYREKYKTLERLKSVKLSFELLVNNIGNALKRRYMRLRSILNGSPLKNC